MPVRTQTQQHHVEERSGRVENRCAISMSQSLFVLPGGLFRGSLDWNWVNVLWWHWGLRKHCLAHHPIIAVRTVVGNESLVAKIPGDNLPRETIPELIGREQLVQCFRGRSAREGNPEATLRLN